MNSGAAVAVTAGSAQTPPQVSSADCDATPLLFTFVPTLRRLPTPVHWVDTSQFLVRIPEEACEHSPDTVSRLPADTLLPGPCGRREGAPRTPPGPSEVSGGPAACGPQGMRPGDVFKARCVFIVDSEGEDEATGTPGDPGCSGVVVGTAARPRSLPLTSAVPSDGVRPKVWGPRAPASGAPRDAPPPGPAQFAPPAAPEQFACKAPAFPWVSPTNPPPPSRAGLPAAGASLLPETRSRAPGARGAAGEDETGRAPALPAPPGASRGVPGPAPPAPPAPPSPEAAYLPVRIVTHALSPSPRPFPASASAPAGPSRGSSTGSLSTAAGDPRPAPSRLALLTAILRSGPPPSSPGSGASPAPAPGRPAQPAPPTPRKSRSSSSLGTPSPEPTDLRGPRRARTPPLPPFLAKCPRAPAPAPAVGSAPTVPPLPAQRPPAPPASPSSPTGGREDALWGPEEPGSTAVRPSACPGAQAPAGPVHPPCARSPPPRSPQRRFPPSPALSSLLDRSQAAATPGAGPPRSPSPPSPGAASASPPDPGSSAPPPTTRPSKSPLPGAAALHPSCGGGDAPSARTGASERTGPGPAPPGSLRRPQEPAPPGRPTRATRPEHSNPKPYKTTSSYKAFAAIPTNTLLLEQKALDEPVKTEHVSKDSALGLPVELCSPAQLRQQTEAVCAAIDKVLQDSLSMHAPDSPSRSPKTMLGSETIQTPTTVPRAAGRETKYANLSSASSAVSESQLTKPGVIRPVPVRSRIFLKTEEEVYEPNPFSQYLGFRGGFSSEQQ